MSTSRQTFNATAHRPWQEFLNAKVATIKYGSVQLTVHDGRVTQIEATEKIRLESGQVASMNSSQL